MTGTQLGAGHNSLLVYVEGQLDYAAQGITTIPPRESALSGRARGGAAALQRSNPKRLIKTTWMSGCKQLVFDR